MSLVVHVSRATYPRLRMRFPRGPGTLDGRTVRVGGSRETLALWCSQKDRCAPPQEAEATFEKLRVGSSMLVRMNAVLPQGEQMLAQHVARWKRENPVCG
jgi:hypothetical protein